MVTSISAMSVLLLLVAAPSASAATAYDFDGDARQELAFPVPGWSPGGAPNAGAVFLVKDGRTTTVLGEGSHGIPGTPEGDDAFGASTASADFDGDGHMDLAVAAPGDEVTFVIPGSRGGLLNFGVTSVPMAGPMSAADLDRDGRADLVVGDPSAHRARREDYGSGALRVFRGTRAGLSRMPRTLRRPDRLDDAFGSVLATGDVNGDGWPDIVESAQGETDASDGEEYPGHVSFCAGSPAGPKPCRTVGGPLGGGPTALVVADVTGDGFADIVGGRPLNKYVIENDPAGAVSIWRGTRSGPRRKRIDITQGSPGVPGKGRSGDAFGAAVAAGDVDGDGRSDLVIGAPAEDNFRGRVTYLRGGAGGYSRAGAMTFEQGRGGIPGSRRAFDGFGTAVGLLRFDGDRRADLVIGSPGDRTATVLRGRGSRRPHASVRLTPSRLGLEVPPEPPDALGSFGGALAP